MGQTDYRRYHIDVKVAPDVAPWPSRFLPRVKKHRLIWHIVKEIFHQRGNIKVILSRPCIYGAYGRLVGGLAPRRHSCVGCLRCTTEHPDWVQILRNPDFERMGDSYLKAEQIDVIHYEAQAGGIPVKGAGYRGKFGGVGWDGMWTDMSEIVRPTRDGIHGREFISTVVDLGEKPPFLKFDEQGLPVGQTPHVFSLPLPILFDIPPASVESLLFLTVLARAAEEIGTLVVLPVSVINEFRLDGCHIVPLVKQEESEMLNNLPFRPKIIELTSEDETFCSEVQSRFPQSLLCLRINLDNQMPERLLRSVESGFHVFHLAADYHGQGANGEFALSLIRKAHQTLVDANCRNEVTLLGSGGIVAAEHVPKAIICGLDAVALDTVLPVALQARLVNECVARETSQFKMHRRVNVTWGIQRIKNLVAAWRDQMLEVLGAMGLREVRRLRGETGRAMFQKDLEREAFTGITGYGNK